MDKINVFHKVVSFIDMVDSYPWYNFREISKNQSAHFPQIQNRVINFQSIQFRLGVQKRLMVQCDMNKLSY